MHPFKRDLCIFILILVGSFWTYRMGIIAMPRGDHMLTISERSVAPSDSTFFLNLLSHNRTRKLEHYDYYLFRPAMMGLLAIEDILWRDNLYLVGILSLIWHALAAFTVYLLLRTRISWKIALLPTLAFTAQYPGMEMILWRHISPYIFGLLFFGVGVLILTGLSRTNHRIRQIGFAAACFFFSALFHETAALVLPLVWALFVVTKRSETSLLSRSEVFFLFLFPAVLYWGIDIVDFVYRRPPTILGPSDTFKPDHLFESVAVVVGFHVLSFLFPETVSMHFGSILKKAELESEFFHSWWIIGLVLLFVVPTVLLIWGPRFARKYLRPTVDLGFVLFFAYLLVMLGGFAIGRINLRTTAYFGSSTYYLYTGRFVLTVLVGWALRDVLASKRTVAYLFGLFFLWHIGFAVHKIPQLLGPMQTALETVARSTSEIAGVLKRNQDYCYGGTEDPTLSRAAPLLILYRESCFARKATPLYGVRQENGSFALATQEKQAFQRVRPTVWDERLSLLLTDRSYDPTQLVISPSDFHGQQIIFAYQGPRDFLRLSLNINFSFRLDRIEKGKVVEVLTHPPLFHPVGPPTIALRLTPGETTLFQDDVIIATTSAIKSFEGRIGFTSQRESAEIRIGGHAGRPPTRLPVHALQQRPHFASDPYETIWEMSPEKNVRVGIWLMGIVGSRSN